MILSKDIIKEWGLENLSDMQRMEMTDRIGRIMYQAILVRSLDILSDKEEQELDALLDTDSTTPPRVLAFLKSKIPTFGLLVKEQRQKLKEDLFVSTA